MDRLTTLNSFIRACETGSFSAAARDLGLSQPAVSQQIRALEEHLGVRLFDRTTRQVSPTEAGRNYLVRARDIIERLDEADRSVGSMGVEMRGRLAIGAPVGFGSNVLGNYLLEFKRTYPDLLLDVSLSDSFVDVIAEGLDVAIRMGNIDDERLIVRRLGVVSRCLAATPDYLDRKGRLQTPDDLLNHDYLLYAHLVSRDLVPLIGPGGQKAEVRIRPTFKTDNSILIYNALLAGLGIGLGHHIIIAQHIAEGRLEYVLPEWRYPVHDVHAVYPSNRFIPLKVKRFVDGFIEYLANMGAFIDETHC